MSTGKLKGRNAKKNGLSLESRNLSRLYLKDETAWLDEMARLIQMRRYGELDYRHLQEYLQDMARRDRREVKSRLILLMTHLLKREYQAWESSSWGITIKTQRHALQSALDSGTLKNYANEILQDAYRAAVKDAADQTELDESAFPPECPFTLDDILTREP